MIEQGTPEWHMLRLGKVTASKIADVMSKGRGSAPSATRANYVAQLVAERLSGRPTEGFTSAAMQHGTETEPQARAVYMMTTGRTVQEVGFIEHPTIPQSGASPDGLVGDDGLIEIKCPNTATHIESLLGGSIPDKYIKQMHFQMMCTGRVWCDFVSFDPRMPDAMQMHIQRIHLDLGIASDIEFEVVALLAEVAETVADLLERFLA